MALKKIKPDQNFVDNLSKILFNSFFFNQKPINNYLSSNYQIDILY